MKYAHDLAHECLEHGMDQDIVGGALGGHPSLNPLRSLREQVQQVAQPGMFSPAIVSDYVFAKDGLFARLNLSDDEYRLYAQMHAQVAPQVPEPDLVIWLQAGPATLMQRIRRRGIGMEQGIGEPYLQRLCDAYVEYFHAYDAAPVFAVGTEHFNPVERDADFAVFVERLAAFRGPREFFNSHVELKLG